MIYNIVLMICFLFISLLNLKNKTATTSLTLWICSPGEHPEKCPIFLCHSQSSQVLIYFPLPLSILVGTNLIMLLLFFFNLRLIPKKIHAPFNFQENSSSFDFWENPCKTPNENQKNCFFFAPCAFWICSRVSLLLWHWI